jgi:hypothetical protein
MGSYLIFKVGIVEAGWNNNDIFIFYHCIILNNKPNKNVNIKVSAHDAFL